MVAVIIWLDKLPVFARGSVGKSKSRSGELIATNIGRAGIARVAVKVAPVPITTGMPPLSMCVATVGIDAQGSLRI